jgi:hypothetical protein
MNNVEIGNLIIEGDQIITVDEKEEEEEEEEGEEEETTGEVIEVREDLSSPDNMNRIRIEAIFNPKGINQALLRVINTRR